MKINKPFIIHIPAKVVTELDKYLLTNKPSFNYDVLYFYYCIHYILNLQLKNKNKLENMDSECVPLNIKNLKSLTVSNIGLYIKILKNGEFIISDNQYIVGEKSIGYAINPKYLGEVKSIEVKPQSKLFKKILNNQNKRKAHYNRLEPFLKQMKDNFMKVELDYQNAEKWILTQPNDEKTNSYKIALGQLKDKRERYFKRNKTNNRLDTNLTNLKSDFRQFIKGDYVSIDLKNSQPFFLSMLFKQVINQYIKTPSTLCYYLDYCCMVETFRIKRLKSVLKIRHFEEKSFLVNLSDFNKRVIDGTLYDNFVIAYSNQITRKQAKNIMFTVLFSKNKVFRKYNNFIPYKEDKEKFASIYPVVYDVIKALKENDNTLLPIYLQKIESYIFIDCIAKELVNAGIVPLTIHDSVIVKTEHQEKTIEIMNRVFMDNFNVIPTLKIEQLSNN